uniref:DNA 3'-5' helicase n=1 Tax=Neogobius melanostomus TaxID=47308 RepID=A0A8C6U030_9GOBI
MAAAATQRSFASALSAVLNELNLSLKPQQEAALKAFLLNNDVFATLPTGFGKSLIYQLAPLVAKKMDIYVNPVVVVVSPLVALMEQQVKEASKLGVTAMQLGENSDKEIFSGQAQLLFGSPEAWLLNDKWRCLLSSQTDLVGVVVDEVHLTYKCLITHYLFTGTPILALTASGSNRHSDTPQLHLDNAMVLTESPNRFNIRLGVQNISGSSLDSLDWIVEEIKGKGLSLSHILIYCRTLKDSWVDRDPEHKLENMLIGMFHSKTLQQNKSHVLSSFSGEGNCRVVVATTALGMGLHFPTVSHVVLYGVPEDVEAIVQEIGRAGRNGAQSHAVVYCIKQHKNVGHTVKLNSSQSTCFRKALYGHFDKDPCSVLPGHLCCTYCHLKCVCQPDGCKEPLPLYEQPRSNASVFTKSREVTDDDRVLLRDLLEQYQDSLLHETTHLCTSKTACTGFGEELIEAVIEHSSRIFEVSYITSHLPVFAYKHA